MKGTRGRGDCLQNWSSLEVVRGSRDRESSPTYAQR
jgi:hypothetical protein